MVSCAFFFFFHHPPPTEIYTLSLHDALPISVGAPASRFGCRSPRRRTSEPHPRDRRRGSDPDRSEEHTSELQSRRDLVCRLLLEKKKKKQNYALIQNKDRSRTNHKCKKRSLI